MEASQRAHSPGSLLTKSFPPGRSIPVGVCDGEGVGVGGEGGRKATRQGRPPTHGLALSGARGRCLPGSAPVTTQARFTAESEGRRRMRSAEKKGSPSTSIVSLGERCTQCGAVVACGADDLRRELHKEDAESVGGGGGGDGNPPRFIKALLTGVKPKGVGQ
jgi:hypothetical protein